MLIEVLNTTLCKKKQLLQVSTANTLTKIDFDNEIENILITDNDMT